MSSLHLLLLARVPDDPLPDDRGARHHCTHSSLLCNCAHPLQKVGCWLEARIGWACSWAAAALVPEHRPQAWPHGRLIQHHLPVQESGAVHDLVKRSVQTREQSRD